MNPLFRIGRLVFPSALACACVACAASLRSAEEDADRIIELPKFVVTDSRILPDPEPWRYAALPGVEILSNASDHDTESLISEFQRFRNVLDAVWPMPQKMRSPLMVVICGARSRFDQFKPVGKRGEGEKVELFMTGRNRAAIVLDQQARVIAIVDPDMAQLVDRAPEDMSQLEVPHDRRLYREYVLYLLSRSDPRLPAWFEEGMTQVLMAMRIDERGVELARIDPDNTVSADAREDLPPPPAIDHDFNYILKEQAMMPLGQMLALGHDSEEAKDPLNHVVWAKQSYAFVHMCLYGRGGKWRQPFGKYLMRASNEPATEALFKECFGRTYKQMALELRMYAEFTDHEIKQFKPKGGAFPGPQPIELRDAAPTEIGYIKGSVMLMAGRVDEARLELIAPYYRGERDPRLLSALGYVERLAGKDDRARKFLTAAVAGNTTDADAYFELAKYRFADASAAPGAPGGRFSAEQTKVIVDLLLKARTLPPLNREVFELLADTWQRSAAKPTEADVLPLVAASRSFPTQLNLVYVTAKLCSQADVNDAAAALVAHGLKYAPDATVRRRFEQLKAALPPASTRLQPAKG